MESFEQFKKKLLKDKEFRKAYEDLEPQFAVIRAIIRARINRGITQKEFAKRMGTTQSAVARLESGRANPTVALLKRAADALDAKLTISVR